MNAVPGLDDYLLDLLSGEAPAPVAPRDDANHAHAAIADVPAVMADDISQVDPPFVYAHDVPAVAESVRVAPVAVVATSAVADGESRLAPAFAGATSDPLTPVDTSAALLAEFDQEFPEQTVEACDASSDLDAVADVMPAEAGTQHLATDTLDALLAEFDQEFPEQAAEALAEVMPTEAHAAIDTLDALLAEFDQEFPEQAAEAVADVMPANAGTQRLAADNSTDLLAEFDAEFPEQAAAEPIAPSAPALAREFAAAVAEETAADSNPHAPATPMMQAPPALPAYAKPVFDMLQRQAQEQASSPHGGDRRRASDRASRWLRMRCDDQHYALELLKVQEVVLPAILLPLRGAARHMLGVMNLRGQVVPVIDLGLYLGREAIVDDTLTRIVVLEEQGEILGLRVSAVEDVTTLTEQQIEPPDNTRMCRITHPLFRGVARLGQQRTVILLDASELLS